MRILIVDDEALARIGLRTLIRWEDYGCQIVGEASNVYEARELALKLRPDVILVDIIMPGMNGFEFIQSIKKELPLCRFIIVSCMDESDCYKKAISLGVSGYIVKNTIDSKEMLQVLERIKEDIAKQRIFDSSNDDGKEYVNENAILTEFLNMVLKKQISDSKVIENKLKLYDVIFDTAEKYIIVFKFDYIEAVQDLYDGEHDYAIVSVCQEIIREMGGGFIFKNFADVITAIVGCPGNQPKTEFINSLFHRIKETLRQYFDVTVTAGLSSLFENFGDIHDEYEEAVAALDRMFFNGPGRLYTYKSEYDENELRTIESLKKSLHEISSIYETEKIEEILQSALNMMSSAQSITSLSARDLYFYIYYYMVELIHKENINDSDIFGFSFNISEYLKKPKNLAEMNSAFKNLVNMVKNYIYSRHKDEKLQLIKSINEYVENNLEKKIKLEDIANHVHFSREYVCRIYKNETGMTLQNYIISRKIELAKKMLMKISSLSFIAEKLDFSSASYLIKLFKTQTGLTPAQYLKKFRI